MQKYDYCSEQYFEQANLKLIEWEFIGIYTFNKHIDYSIKFL